MGASLRTLVGLVGLVGLGACGKGASSSPEVTGTLTVDGKPVTVVGCRPGHNVHTFVELITPSGVLRFEDTKLFWNPDREAIQRGPELVCTQLDRSWGGGNRVDGSSYWRGRLEFRCGPIGGTLELDCGHITPNERAELDRGRTDLLDQRKGSESPGTP